MRQFFVLIATIQFFSMTAGAQTVYPLYENGIPNSKETADKEKAETKDGILRITNVSRPTLTVFLPQAKKATGAAVIICPGGGYGMLAAGHEGVDVARKFNEMGVAAMVLKYRLPDSTIMTEPETGPLQDAQQAIKTVRERAPEWNIRRDRIGIMGFSAGGHLASRAGTHFKKNQTGQDGTSLRPDFLILIYPVISFQEGLIHRGSAENLLGKDASAEKLAAYSNELQVTGETPPAFLIHASDDDGVKAGNSIAFYNALLRNKVPAELHLYQQGGHGFGMHMKNSKESWMLSCRNWMELNGWMK